jgi:peptidoglycan/xylan/chitin deacetylase (PgdA/CDA1 family)
MVINISIHVDGYYGLIKGVPNLLRLFDKYNIRASFFVNMGREANIFQILKYRKSSQISKEDRKVSSRYSKRKLIEMALLNRKMGQGHGKLLREIKARGHEVNPHCWSHLLWSKNFSKVDHLSEIRKMRKSYFDIFGVRPKGFAPPTWKFNDKVIEILKREGFEYLAVNDCFPKICKRRGLNVVPLSFGKNIEELENEGRSHEEILKIYRKKMKERYVNLYFHADYEGLVGIGIFEEILKMIGNRKTKTYEELLK